MSCVRAGLVHGFLRDISDCLCTLPMVGNAPSSLLRVHHQPGSFWRGSWLPEGLKEAGGDTGSQKTHNGGVMFLEQMMIPWVVTP